MSEEDDDYAAVEEWYHGDSGFHYGNAVAELMDRAGHWKGALDKNLPMKGRSYMIDLKGEITWTSDYWIVQEWISCFSGAFDFTTDHGPYHIVTIFMGQDNSDWKGDTPPDPPLLWETEIIGPNSHYSGDWGDETPEENAPWMAWAASFEDAKSDHRVAVQQVKAWIQ